MAKLMWIAGILLAAIGIALGLMVFFSVASMIAWGVTLETAAILLVGGILSIGLGGVVNGLDAVRDRASAMTVIETVGGKSKPAVPEYGRRQAAPAPTPEVSPEVRETIEKIERAKQDLSQAFGDQSSGPSGAFSEAIVATAPSEAAAEAAVEEIEEAAEDGSVEEQLYVVEERTIRNRPARILSDGTVEAETDEGWMRFENLEHLDEYLEAVSPSN